MLGPLLVAEWQRKVGRHAAGAELALASTWCGTLLRCGEYPPEALRSGGSTSKSFNSEAHGGPQVVG